MFKLSNGQPKYNCHLSPSGAQVTEWSQQCVKNLFFNYDTGRTTNMQCLYICKEKLAHRISLQYSNWNSKNNC